MLSALKSILIVGTPSGLSTTLPKPCELLIFRDRAWQASRASASGRSRPDRRSTWAMCASSRNEKIRVPARRFRRITGKLQSPPEDTSNDETSLGVDAPRLAPPRRDGRRSTADRSAVARTLFGSARRNGLRRAGAAAWTIGVIGLSPRAGRGRRRGRCVSGDVSRAAAASVVGVLSGVDRQLVVRRGPSPRAQGARQRLAASTS